MKNIDHRIDTVAGRNKLPPRREQYWQRIETGSYIGFRKLVRGEGTWHARWRDEEGLQHYHPLGHQPDIDTAIRAARPWFAQCEGGTPKVITIAEACRQYVEERRIAKGKLTADDAEGRFKRTVYGNPLGRIEIGRVKSGDLTRWLHSLVKTSDEFEDEDEETNDIIRRSKDSANRNLASLKAALNQAYRNGMAPSSGAWDRVLAFPNVGARRTRFLNLADRQALVIASPDDLANLIKSIAHTGARPGEVAKAQVRNLHSNGALELDGKTGRRLVPLSKKAHQHFLQCANNRDDDEPLLLRNDGHQWDRYAWRDAMQLARSEAGLPSDVVLYNIRHAAISEMIIGGMDPLTTARITGTSLEMIQKHYGHLREAQAVAVLSKLKLI